MSQLVFAFGSNMCSARLRDHGVAIETSGVPARLPGYRLRFDKRSRDLSGKANLEICQGRLVWGVLYELADDQLITLDRGEGGGYARSLMMVERDDHQAVSAWVYTARTPEKDELRPYDWYLRFIVEGAKEHGLPHLYISELERIEVAHDPDLERDKNCRSLQCKDAG